MCHAGLEPDGVVMQSDCSKAYTQAPYQGVLTYIRLPKKWWPKEWVGKFKDPVCKLQFNLYGHPCAGRGWEDYFTAIVVAKRNGFVEVPNWPSVFWHAEHRILLVVYVDDLVAAGTRARVEQILQPGFKLLE